MRVDYSLMDYFQDVNHNVSLSTIIDSLLKKWLLEFEKSNIKIDTKSIKSEELSGGESRIRVSFNLDNNSNNISIQGIIIICSSSLSSNAKIMIYKDDKCINTLLSLSDIRDYLSNKTNDTSDDLLDQTGLYSINSLRYVSKQAKLDNSRVLDGFGFIKSTPSNNGDADVDYDNPTKVTYIHDKYHNLRVIIDKSDPLNQTLELLYRTNNHWNSTMCTTYELIHYLIDYMNL